MRLQTGKSVQGSLIWFVQFRLCCSLGCSVWCPSGKPNVGSHDIHPMSPSCPQKPLHGQVSHPCKRRQRVDLCPFSISFSLLNIGTTIFTWKCSTKNWTELWSESVEHRKALFISKHCNSVSEMSGHVTCVRPVLLWIHKDLTSNSSSKSPYFGS